MGARVRGYALAPDVPSLSALLDIGRDIDAIHADVRDADALGRAMRGFRPDIVLHLAAQSLVRASYADPIGTYSTNVMGTANLLEAVRACDSVRAVVVVTSDKCYENREWLWGYREDEPMGGYDPYSSSKGCAELLVSSWRRSYFAAPGRPGGACRLASARAGNVIGGGDWSRDRLVPDILKAFEDHRPVRIRFPNAIRPWQHVLEPLRGYLLLAERLFTHGSAFAEGWNFGPDADCERTVSDIADRLCRLWGEGAAWEMDEGSQPHEARLLKLDSAKARARLEWLPWWTIDDTLAAIASWHRAYLDGCSVRDVTLAQIAGYQPKPQPERRETLLVHA
ncbi:CDP-glucose 4,6-dehydratase [Azospirillum picis]|uniref:CDP-glucose 4,6-dehydratase n=2 Tax=Azospirillum picis TaxID=488438 RepID=A0ABU0MRI5_9PROT|nr:CDP-glucose 4,6-dehydratase [Azospirillum picis]MDQ0536098.1 CDP-glucose 4,6-dehydratase [Azospirillum picis]